MYGQTIDNLLSMLYYVWLHITSSHGPSPTARVSALQNHPTPQCSGTRPSTTSCMNFDRLAYLVGGARLLTMAGLRCLFFSIILVLGVRATTEGQLKNVLFFAVDDLRPELGTYGSNIVKSPNLDDLASKSMVFERAYCQIAVCSPSRASLLTGRRPDTNHVWEIAADEYWRDYTNATTIPQYFKENGYISVGMGKIFHPGAPSGNDDKAYSWSLPYYHAPLSSKVWYSGGPAWMSYKGYEDNPLPDGQVADNAISTLQAIKQNRTKGDKTPFFLAVGFYKPHLPFRAPSNIMISIHQLNRLSHPRILMSPQDFHQLQEHLWRS